MASQPYRKKTLQNNKLKAQLLKGIALSFLVGLLSFLIAPYIPGINGVILSFILGVAIGNLVRLPNEFMQGVKFSSSKILEASIVLLAFSISFSDIQAIGPSKFALIAITIVLVLSLTIYLAKVLNCPAEGGWLVGFGTAICGSSAIAALAPSVTKNTEDTGIAIAIVNLIGSIAMVIMPFALKYLEVSDLDSSIYIGASLHSVGNVMGAGFGMDNPTIGENALTIKMARVALLTPAIIFFNILVQAGKKRSLASYFKLPPYLWAFIAITILVSVVDLPQQFLATAKLGGKFLLIVAMAAIGLKVSLRQLVTSGRKALKFGVMIFALQLIIIGLLLMVL